MERFSKQRAAIRSVIDRAQRPLSPQEVLDAGQSAVAGLGLATVYRNLKVLLEAGEIKAVTLPGDSPRYESANHGHHHHFQCNACQRVFDVHECPGNLAALAPVGFTVERHEITLYGRCKDCSAPQPDRAAGFSGPPEITSITPDVIDNSRSIARRSASATVA